MSKGMKDGKLNIDNSYDNMRRYYSDITAICIDCGEEFTITGKEQKFADESDNNFVLPKRCKKCRDDRRAKMKLITCSECGEQFQFSINEQNYYETHGLKEPKRCPECRKNKSHQK